MAEDGSVGFCLSCHQFFPSSALPPAPDEIVPPGALLLPLIPRLPSTLALMLSEYAHEQNDYLALHRICSALEITARFPVNEPILEVTRAINREAGLTPDKSPSLELPDEAWDEPRLLSECPLCPKPLKFNPFIVDNRDRY